MMTYSVVDTSLFPVKVAQPLTSESTEMELNCLFENEHYVVCQISGSGALRSEGVEVVSKDSLTTTYLTGRMRKVFMRQVADWREKPVELEAVEARLEQFTILNANPLVLH